MKILLDIPKNKVSFFMEVLENFKFVKAKKLSIKNVGFYEGLRESVTEVNQIKKSEKKGKTLSKYLNG